MPKATGEKKAVKGMTLIELVAVIIIVAILSTIGFTQFGKTIEKSRSAEAKTILGQLRGAQHAYHLKYSTYATAMGLDVDAPTSCTSTHYFSYSIPSASDSDFTLAATRCTSTDSKEPPASSGFSITVDAAGDWSGTAGYY
ncbi:MAG: type IV pilin protein [Candidatus Omnitrophica bacterium]|nr:type IV pilin protein [Candidatus Omnitrophota bacterium]